ncbi:hypothetical protein SVIOM342S_08219 [Streptomyces violaceorubidus]
MEKRSGACITMSHMNVRPTTRTWVRWRSRSAMARRTSNAVLSRTPPRPLSTRSTVASLRPACRAISRIGKGCPMAGSSASSVRRTLRGF